MPRFRFAASDLVPYLVAAFFALAVAVLVALADGRGSARAQDAAPGAETDAALVSLADIATPADRSARIADFVDGFHGGTVPLSEATGATREFILEVHTVTREIAPGVEVEQWAFAFPGEEPTVPGPEIRVTQGDLVRITLRNTHDQPHSIHPHGITSLAMQMDGVSATSFMVMPGEAFTYEFVAANPGTHAYHCHVQTNVHLDMGMYGAIVVEPADESAVVWDVEHSLTIDEWDADQNPLGGVHTPEPDHYLVNGKAFPLTDPLEIDEGDVGLIRITNVGYATHALHLHGMAFLVIAKDGYDLPQPYRGDTLAVAPGERYDILVKGRDGTFPFHDHVVTNVANAGVYPGGMLTLIAGGDARTVTDAPESVYHGREAAPERFVADAPDAGHDATEGRAHEHDAPSTSNPTANPAANADAETATGTNDAAIRHAAAPATGEVTVRITEFAFDAPVLRVAAGTTVTWINDDVAPHTVTAGAPGDAPETRAFDSTGTADEATDGAMEMMAQGDSWSYTFTQPGSYAYYCLPHPFMTATVIVE